MSVDWTRACFTLDEVCTGVVCLQIIVINFAYACDAQHVSYALFAGDNKLFRKV